MKSNINPSKIAYKNKQPFNLFLFVIVMVKMHKHELIIYVSNIQDLREAYLVQFASHKAIWVSLGMFWKLQLEWSRAGLEWSRTPRVVARVLSLNCGRGTEWSRTAQVVAHPARVVAHQKTLQFHCNSTFFTIFALLLLFASS